MSIYIQEDSNVRTVRTVDLIFPIFVLVSSDSSRIWAVWILSPNNLSSRTEFSMTMLANRGRIHCRVEPSVEINIQLVSIQIHLPSVCYLFHSKTSGCWLLLPMNDRSGRPGLKRPAAHNKSLKRSGVWSEYACCLKGIHYSSCQILPDENMSGLLLRLNQTSLHKRGWITFDAFRTCPSLAMSFFCKLQCK